MHGPAVSAQPIEDLPFLARKAVGQIFEYPGKFAGLRLRLADGEPDFVGENIIPVERGILFLQKLFQRGLDAFKIMEIFQQTASFPPTGTCGRADFLNDVALLTIVPLTIVIAQNARTDPVRLIILETLAANLFSALTPFGNPQNLYLYSYFHIPPAQFFAATVPFCAGSAVVLAALGLGWNRGGGGGRRRAGGGAEQAGQVEGGGAVGYGRLWAGGGTGAAGCPPPVCSRRYGSRNC